MCGEKEHRDHIFGDAGVGEFSYIESAHAPVMSTHHAFKRPLKSPLRLFAIPRSPEDLYKDELLGNQRPHIRACKCWPLFLMNLGHISSREELHAGPPCRTGPGRGISRTSRSSSRTTVTKVWIGLKNL